MHVTWERTWPRWLGVACAVFGFANVIGALTVPLRLMLPGVVVGSVFAVLGLKQGPPLFASTCQAMAPLSERIVQGLRTIRRRRLFAFVSILAWLPIAAVILPRVPDELMVTVGLLTWFPVLAFFTTWTLSACPRCNGYFFPVLRLRARAFMWPFLNRCDKCGLGFHGVQGAADRPGVRSGMEG